jgi:hypothetical protein
MRTLYVCLLTCWISANPHPATAAQPPGSRVVFDKEGIAQVDGKPFFPVVLFTYELNPEVLAEIIMMDEARRVHGPNWPQWTYIQVFGGPETDNGIWAVPLPHEVRFMAYQALVHRATGILYFSYWPRQPRTWQSVAALNREIQQIVPRLIAPGQESVPKAESPEVQVRARSTSRSGLVLAINTSPRFVQTTLQLGRHHGNLTVPFEGRTVEPSPKGLWTERFAPYGVHVYVWGPEPTVRLAREDGPAQ